MLDKGTMQQQSPRMSMQLILRASATTLNNAPERSLDAATIFKSGLDYSYLCSKPLESQDKEQTKLNYRPDTFAECEVLLKELPDQFQAIDEGKFHCKSYFPRLWCESG